MSVVKVSKPQGPFEVIDRASVDAIKDPTALAMWVFLRCKPEGWVVRETHVRDQFGIGRDKYRSALRYLVDVGAVEDRRIQGDQGRIIGRELVIHYAVTQADGNPVTREPEIPAHGISNDKGSGRAPEIPSHGAHREPEKPVRRRKPTDGKSAPLENTDYLENTDSLENTKVARSKRAGIDLSVLPDSLSPDLWRDFVANRKAIKKPISTQTAVNGIARELRACEAEGIPSDTALTIAIEKCWQGLKPAWVKNVLQETGGHEKSRKPSSAPRTAAERGEAFGAECWGRINAQRQADAGMD